MFAIRLYIFSLMLVFLVSAIPAAKAQQVYTVENVKVDVRAENPVNAREQAFTQAKEQAFGALASKLGTRSEWALQGDFDHLIQDFEITDEKIAPDRYAATYTFRFERFKVQRYLSSVEPPSQDPSSFPDLSRGRNTDNIPPGNTPANTPAAEQTQGNRPAEARNPRFSQLFKAEEQRQATPSGDASRATTLTRDPVLLLPYWHNGNQTYLWGSGNQWRHTWKRLERTAGAGAEFILPLGDLADLREIDDELPRDPAKLARLLARYSASQVMVAVGRQEQQSIKADLYIGDENGLTYWQEINAPLGPRQDPYSVAAGQLLKKVRKVSKDLPQVAAGQASSPLSSSQPFYNQGSRFEQQEIEVESQFNNVQQWMQIRALLKRTAGIDHIEILSLKPQSALIYLQLSQPLEQVQQVLWRRNLQLEQQNGAGNQSPAYQLRVRSNGV